MFFFRRDLVKVRKIEIGKLAKGLAGAAASIANIAQFPYLEQTFRCKEDRFVTAVLSLLSKQLRNTSAGMFHADQAAEKAQDFLPLVVPPIFSEQRNKLIDGKRGRLLQTVFKVACAEVLKKGAVDKSILVVSQVGQHKVALAQHPNQIASNRP